MGSPGAYFSGTWCPRGPARRPAPGWRGGGGAGGPKRNQPGAACTLCAFRWDPGVPPLLDGQSRSTVPGAPVPVLDGTGAGVTAGPVAAGPVPPGPRPAGPAA